MNSNESRVNDVIVPALKKAKVKTGSTAILNITGTDTTAAQAQVDSFVEKWKSEGVNMVFLAGNLVSAKQFAESIKAGLPKATLVTDTDTSLDQAKGEQNSGVSPNPYEGMISGTGLTQSERWANKSPILQQCVDIYEKATGTTVPGPDERKVNADGKQINTDQAVTNVCGDLMMFKQIAEKTGKNLTTKNWQKTVDSFGKVELPPNQFSSLCKGKYDAQDDFQLISYDSSLGTAGDWKTLTPVKDAKRRQVHQGSQLGARRTRRRMTTATCRVSHPGVLSRPGSSAPSAARRDPAGAAHVVERFVDEREVVERGEVARAPGRLERLPQLGRGAGPVEAPCFGLMSSMTNVPVSNNDNYVVHLSPEVVLEAGGAGEHGLERDRSAGPARTPRGHG